MKNIILLGILFLSLVFARRDCLQLAPRDVLGRTMRPDKDTFAISPSGHFYIHFDTTGSAAPDLTDSDGNGIPDYVDKVCIYADSAYFMLVESMGYNVEPADNDGIYDIYIKYFAPGKYGFNWSEGLGVSYLEIASNYEGYDSFATPEQLMQITLSHEYFHAIQRGYKPSYSSGDAYFLEMSSMWFEDIIVPNGNDYLGEKWTDGVLENPTVTFDNTGPGYELALFGHYLSSFIDITGSNNGMHSHLIRNIWEDYKSTSAYPRAFTSIKNILNGVNYPSFIECWIDFISRNLYNGIYENMDNPFYYYIDQALIDPIKTTSVDLTDSTLFGLNLDNESASIKSFRIGILESIFTIEHGSEEYTGRVAIVSSNESNLNNLFWGSDTTVIESYSNVKVHFVYGVEGTSITLPIEITAHTVPMPPSNLQVKTILSTFSAAEDNIELSWIKPAASGNILHYLIYRNEAIIDTSFLLDIDTLNYIDYSISGSFNYTYMVTCVNENGESAPSNSVSIQSWPTANSISGDKILSIFPNPIRKTNNSEILYTLGSDYSSTMLELINIRGQIVKTILLQSDQKGWHRENINNLVSPEAATGIYIIRLQPVNGFGRTQKITILP